MGCSVFSEKASIPDTAPIFPSRNQLLNFLKVPSSMIISASKLMIKLLVLAICIALFRAMHLPGSVLEMIFHMLLARPEFSIKPLYAFGGKSFEAEFTKIRFEFLSF